MRRKLWKGIGLLLACSTIAGCQISGIQSNNQDVMQSYVIYFAEDNGFSTMTYRTECIDTAEVVNELMSELGIMVAKIEDVYLLRSNISDGVLYLYFNSEYSKIDSRKEVLFRTALVKTLTQVDGIEELYFYVDGNPLTYENGQVVGGMRAEDYVTEINKNLAYVTWEKFVLYYAKENGRSLVECAQKVLYSPMNSKEEIVLEQLIRGPEQAKVQNIMPIGTQLLGVSLKNGICYVDFSEEFLNPLEKVSYTITIQGIVKTLCALNSVERVKISVQGDSQHIVDGVDLQTIFDEAYFKMEVKP